MYHAVGDGEWAIQEKAFARQMEWIAREARPLSLVQALGTDVERPLEVALTFDDGYASVFAHGFPILKSLGLTASMFLNTGLVGLKQRTPSDPQAGHYPGEEFLLWSEVDALLDAGWVMGSHGEHHLDHSREPVSVVRRELSGSKKRLEEILPGPCLYFAYTWGRHTPQLRRLVAEAGYRWGLAGVHGPVRPSGDPFAVPRINIDQTYTLDDLRAVLRGDWDYLRFLQAWRARS
jgi:peptidoglycan/xylan/chitin deacetylase (PgdA/CDA1 family)